jgi:ribosomal protein S13
MEIEPLEYIESNDLSTGEKASEVEKKKSQLNSAVAVTVAILATFMGICKIKDDNIVQAMQQAQASKIDDWSFYQTRNLREEIAQSVIVQLRLQKVSQPSTSQETYEKQIQLYQNMVEEQNKKKEALKIQAENDQIIYDQLNVHDDQFDLSDAGATVAISLLAVTALTQKRVLFAFAMLPTAFGLVMGIAGLLGWALHPDALSKLLS